ncbi:MAG: hypothetical protein ACJ789_09535 [Thermomicrobiales bacterium]
MPTVSPDELAKQARFIFRGTVQRLRATTMADVPATDRTVVVRVDEVVQAPPALAQTAGQEITVQLGSRERVKQGLQATFYTNGWLFGESLAVRSIGHRPLPAIPASLAGPTATPAQESVSRDLQARLSGAEMVVTGRVASVRIPETPTAGLAFGVEGQPRGAERYSEHDPLWREAVVNVDSIEKGRGKPKSVVVRFPASDDVRWRNVPKLEPGQEGVFILHQPAGVAAGAAAVREAGGPVYAVSHSLDVRPSEQLGQIKQLISTTN